MLIHNLNNEENFNDLLQQHDGILFLIFTATWCGPCKSLKNNLEEIQASGMAPENIMVAFADVDQLPDFSNKHQIRSVPSVLVYANHTFKESLIGKNLTPELLGEVIAKYS